MPIYAITGATGQLGHLVVQALLTRGVPAGDVIAVVRNPGKAADLSERGVQVREGDYSRPDTLAAALSGVERLLLVSSSVPGERVAHHNNVIEAAKAAGVTRIVYTSIINADDTTNPLAGEHQGTEALIRAAGRPFTFLRNGWYIENYTAQLADYLARGEIVGAAGRGRLSAATRADFADAAVAALLQDGSGDRVHELGGPAFELVDLAQVISKVTGTKVAYRDLTAGEYADGLTQAGLAEGNAAFVASLDTSIAHGDLETDSKDLEHLLGRPATSLTDAVRAAHTMS